MTARNLTLIIIAVAVVAGVVGFELNGELARVMHPEHYTPETP